VFKRSNRDERPDHYSYHLKGEPAEVDPASWPGRDEGPVQQHAAAYEQGRDALMQRITSVEGAPFVATVRAMRGPDGCYTTSIWSEGVLTLLGAVDVLRLLEQTPGDDESPVHATDVRWNVVAEACADTCWRTQEDLDPVRVLTVAWPSPEQMTWLKARALQSQRLR
jgi:hypothetical protein